MKGMIIRQNKKKERGTKLKAMGREKLRKEEKKRK